MRKSIMMTIIVLMAALVSGGCKNKNAKDNNNLMLLLSAGHEAMGLYDETFNRGGHGANEFVHAIAVQNDGKILVGGQFRTYNLMDVPGMIMRLNADGTPDTTFNNGGSGAGSAGTPLIYSIAVQDDGKILIGGNFSTYNDVTVQGGILRLNADGTRDTTFNNGGSGTGTAATVNAILIQNDGKILIGGSFADYNGVADAPSNIMRLNTDGTRDVTFNNAGDGPGGVIYAMAMQRNGMILIGGDFPTYNGDDLPNHVIRLNADGTPDPGFNNGGTGAGTSVRAIAVQGNGSILIGGNFTSYNGSPTVSRFIMQLNADGTEDTGFNNGGAGLNNPVFVISALTNGKILVGGQFTAYNGITDTPNFVMRLNADGTIDNSFNTGGAGSGNYLRAISVLNNGKILIGGAFGSYNGVDVPQFVIRLR